MHNSVKPHRGKATDFSTMGGRQPGERCIRIDRIQTLLSCVSTDVIVGESEKDDKRQHKCDALLKKGRGSIWVLRHGY